MEKKPPQKQKHPKEEGGIESVVIVVASVLVILVVIWLLAYQLISMTGTSKNLNKRLGIGQSEEPLSSEEEQSELVSSVEESMSVGTEASQSEELQKEEASSDNESDVPSPQTEGDANYKEPNTWIGKTFTIKDSANVRSGMGTDQGVVGGVSVGQKVTVVDAKFDGSVVWVKARYEESGQMKEGWIYGYALNTEAVK